MAGPGASRRPKLSLQTKPMPGSQVRTRRSALANADPKSPTTFNTLSNVYMTAIERSTPTQVTPLTAIKMQQQPLKLRTDAATLHPHQNPTLLQPTFPNALPDTPLSANPLSPGQPMDIVFPSQQMTATPPLSAGATDASGHRPFSFAESSEATKNAGNPHAPSSPAQARRRAIYSAFGAAAAAAAGGIQRAPYTRNRSLHSILRNSPLPPASAAAADARSPVSPRRQSRRLQERAARRVGYESPLTQTITTEKYTQSHIDLLLAEEAGMAGAASPTADADADAESDSLVMTAAEARDGGQTPGPFEDMRRRMTGLAATGAAAENSPLLSPRTEGGVRKRGSSSGAANCRRRKEKRRKWVWTIGNHDEEEGDAVRRRRGGEGDAGAAVRTGGERPTASSSLSSDVDISTPRASSRPILALPMPPPLPPPRLSIDASVSVREAERTPEPVTAVQISVEAAESQLRPESGLRRPADDDCMDVDMDVDMSSGDDSAAADNDKDDKDDSSRATTPYSMEIDLATPVVTLPEKAAPENRREESERLTSLGPGTAEPESGTTRRGTPIPPDLVTA